MQDSRKSEKPRTERWSGAQSGISTAEDEVVLLSIRCELLRCGRSQDDATCFAAQERLDSLIHADSGAVDRMRALSLLTRELTRTQRLPAAATLRWLDGLGLGDSAIQSVLLTVATHALPNYIEHLSHTPLRWVADCETQATARRCK